MTEALSYDRLTCRCSSDIFGCSTSADGKPLQGIVGQAKALKALQFGLNIKEKGFNIYVSGVPGTGKKTAVKGYLEEIAKGMPTPPDWCYVNNFQENYKPRAISLPPGTARKFKKQVDAFVEGARREISKAFEGEDYAAKRNNAIKQVQQEREELINKINDEAQKDGFVIQATPMGLLTIPVKDNRPLTEEEFRALDKETQNEIQEKQKVLNEELKKTGRQMISIEKKTMDVIEKLDREIGSFTLEMLLEELRENYTDNPKVIDYLNEMKEDMLNNLDMFRADEQMQEKMKEMQMQQMQQMGMPMPMMPKEDMKFRKYSVNVVVDNTDVKGAPIIMELNPSYNNLFGRIEKEAMMGALFTDFTMVRSGSLMRANGGYLILPALDVLRNYFSWESLKRSIRNNDIRIEEPEERLGYLTTRWLVPEPIPWDVKVVLIGSPFIYYRLYELDPDFHDLFKVKADFDRVMDRNDENMKSFSSFVCNVCNEENLKHLDKDAIAKIVEYSSRLAEDQNKLSTEFGDVADVIREASFYASRQNAPVVTVEHVKEAIEEKFNRSNMIQEKIREMIKQGLIMIDVEGEKVGQVNGLSVMEMGDVMFGRPSKITASTGLGTQGLIDIEREAKLGGPIHTKGVLILSGYLANRYAQDKPLSLATRVVFEQSYSGIEGDSASSTELYAILSDLSGVPIKQGIAVTGSVNQKGEVQAIGGVNHKIEGYYGVCKEMGLTGEQGVMIPASNAQNLILKDEVIEAVKEGRFHIWTVSTIDEGIEVLTGRKAGKRDEKGMFEEGSVNSLVDDQLRKFSEMWMNYSGGNHGTSI
ncbi:MAG TPA: ATP-binding protein [Deltaproteobacteria bacterium]|nr:ATP-binding protein [Deltaproteobacteria bacterium]HQJ07542.1 ATP-binding protein [Deltaproteobacteria bacterium]